MKIFFPLSFNLAFWAIVGILRYYFENLFNSRTYLPSAIFKSDRKKIAVCIPAHNEEDVIKEAISSVKKLIPPSQIFVVSDGSNDKTPEIASQSKCNVLVNIKGVGKAKALKGLLKNFRILDKYKYVVFVDADTRLDINYMRRALRYMYFHPEVAALTSHAVPMWKKKSKFGIPDFISAYRTRLYKVLQMSFMYGMTWRYTNVNVVIPGFAALYRTQVLEKLQLDTKGVLIEDFNLAFQVHKKKLGTIAYQPDISATYQDPGTIEDYWNQVRRWNIGFFQTVKVQGFWFSFFWIAVIVFMVELVSFSLFILFLPIAFIVFLLPLVNLASLNENATLAPFLFPHGYIEAIEVFAALVFFDFLLTVAIALIEKKYRLIIYGPFFVVFSFINSLILVSSIKKGLFGKSEGRWSHARRI
jgi:cellulose synthase/poly-beta-1,6-N-acetylglucosamine synthase-like glycosyltransferase